jgi:tetratricopeptide (TPR) repeat protein
MKNLSAVQTFKLITVLLILALVGYSASWFFWWNGFQAAQKAGADGNISQSEHLYEQALATAAPFGFMDPRESMTMYPLACTYVLDQKQKLAQPLLVELEKRTKSASAPPFPKRVDVLNALGGLYVTQYEPGRAVPLYEQGLELLVKDNQGESEQASHFLNTLGKINRDQFKLGQAFPYFERSLALRKKLHGDESEAVMLTLHDLGHAYLLNGEAKRAHETFASAQALASKLHGPTSEVAIKLQNDDAVALTETPDKARAAELFADSMKNNANFEHRGITFCIGRLGYIFDRQGKYDLAQKQYDKALQINQTYKQLDDADFRRAMDCYVAMLKRRGQPEQAALVANAAKPKS